MMTLYHILGTPFGWIMKIIYDLVKKFVQKSLEQKGKTAEMEKYERRFHGGE